jgi:hypothetical protein
MASKTKAPQLVWDRGVPIWRATRAAIKAGFPTKRANLKYFAENEAALVARCYRLTAEQNDWLAGRRGRDPLFDGTIGSVISFWQTELSSPYHRIEASTRHPYAGMMCGQRRYKMVANRASPPPAWRWLS